jgi:hypothetical protein
MLAIPQPVSKVASFFFSGAFAGPVFASAEGGVGGEEGIFSK